MSTLSSATPDDAHVNVCECERWARSACCDEVFDKEHDNKRYCVLHYPGAEKSEDFKKVLERKLDTQDFDFQGAWFPEKLSFQKFTFTGAANFRSARFRAVVDFREAKFSADADFRGAEFNADADFTRAQFGAAAYFPVAHFNANAYFHRAQFSAVADFFGTSFSADAVFNNAQFEAAIYFNAARFCKSAYFSKVVFNATVYFQGARFREKDRHRGNDATGDNNTIDSEARVPKAETIRIDFAGARFKDGLAFTGNKFADRVFMSFAAAILEKPERAVFHSTPLRPHWFINIDPRAFTFININWGDLSHRGAIGKEIRRLETSKNAHLNQLLEITFRQLAVNAEENNRYEEAANFRYMAMEVNRLQRRKFDPIRLRWWYWLLSGYGERVRRAFGALLTIWLLFGFIYSLGNTTWWQPRQTRDVVSASAETNTQRPAVAHPLPFREALVYSAGVMALQKPEPLPANKRAKTLVLLETILGPVQAALLALAIRRKFMR